MERFLKLLLSMDEVLQDRSGLDQLVAASGAFAVDTAQKKFGDGSGKFIDGSDLVTLTASADYNFGGGDFTIDFWARIAAASGAGNILFQHTDGANVSTIKFTATTVEYHHTDGDANTLTISKTVTLTAGVWNHVAVTRRGDNWELYFNGSKATSATHTLIYPPAAGDPILKFHLGGHLDEFRILKGQAFWNAAFTPPTRAWTVRPFARALIDTADDILDEFAEDILYTPLGGTPRTVRAVIDRNPPATVGSQDSFSRRFTITVANSPADGIVPDESDDGGDLVEFSDDLGGPVRDHDLKFVQYQNAGLVQYEVF